MTVKVKERDVRKGSKTINRKMWLFCTSYTDRERQTKKRSLQRFSLHLKGIRSQGNEGENEEEKEETETRIRAMNTWSIRENL